MQGSLISFSEFVGSCLDQHGVDEIDDVPFKYYEDNVSWNYYTDSSIDPGSLPLTKKRPWQIRVGFMRIGKTLVIL